MLNPGSHSRQASLSPLRGIPPATFHLESCTLSELRCSGFSAGENSRVKRDKDIWTEPREGSAG